MCSYPGKTSIRELGLSTACVRKVHEPAKVKMSAKATTEETSRPGLTAVVSTSETSQATEAKSVGTKHQQTNSFETTPTHQDSKVCVITRYFEPNVD